MRVVVVETDSQGGLIHFAYQLSEALSEAGHDTTLLTGTDYELAHLLHRSTVLPMLDLWPPIEPVAARGRGTLTKAWQKLRRGWRAIVLAREWSRLTRHLRADPPDIVIFSMIRFPFLVHFLRSLRKAGIPMLQICHEFDNRERRGRFRGLDAGLAKEIYHAFLAIVFLTRTTRDSFLEIYPDLEPRTFVIPHGPELIFEPTQAAREAVRDRYRISDAEKIVLMFGGLRPSKGVPELLEAFAGLGDLASTRLIVAGYPSREFDVDQVVRRISAPDLSDRVSLDQRYLEMDELSALVGRADVVVFPYRSATASGALALAQSLGRPAVVTAVGGLSEAVQDGETGWVVPPGDHDAMAHAIRTVLSDPVSAEAIAATGRRNLLEQSSWPSIAARIAEIARRH